MIICLDKGLVAGIGTHSQLLENCAAYRKLYEIQFREEDIVVPPPEAGSGDGTSPKPIDALSAEPAV